MTKEECINKLIKLVEECDEKCDQRYKELGINRVFFGMQRLYCSDIIEERDKKAQEVRNEYYKEHPEEKPKD